MNRVLVTGAGGFIGRAVMRSLLRRGLAVDAVGRTDRWRGSYGAESVEWHVTDLLDPASAASLVERTRPAVVIHLAWETRHGEYWRAPSNVDWAAATLRFARSFAQRGGRRFIGAGSCAEYKWAEAQADTPAFDEASAAREPASLYGAAKNATFDLLTAFFAEQRIEFAWGRLFFAYGPGDERPTLVPNLIKALLAGRHALCTTGFQRRDFIHVDDVAEALATLAESSAVGPFNIGTGRDTAVAEVAKKIGTAFGRPDLVRLGALPARPGDPTRLVARIDRIRAATGWTPRISIDDGVRDTVQWWRQRSTERDCNWGGGSG